MLIQYCNTDLDISSPVDLALLVEEYVACGVYSLHPELRRGDHWFATLSTNEQYSEPESTISAMLDAIEAAPDQIKTIWNTCTLREFNIGYDCGDEPWAFNQGLSTATLRRMAALGATLRITLYPPDNSNASDLTP